MEVDDVVELAMLAAGTQPWAVNDLRLLPVLVGSSRPVVPKGLIFSLHPGGHVAVCTPMCHIGGLHRPGMLLSFLLCTGLSL